VGEDVPGAPGRGTGIHRDPVVSQCPFENDLAGLRKISARAGNAVETAVLRDSMTAPREEYSVNINHQRIHAPEDIHVLLDSVVSNLPEEIHPALCGL